VPTTATLIPLLRRDGMSEDDVDRVFSTFNVASFAADRSDT
jgi:sulfhydrogenase subunit delta